MIFDVINFGCCKNGKKLFGSIQIRYIEAAYLNLSVYSPTFEGIHHVLGHVEKESTTVQARCGADL